MSAATALVLLLSEPSQSADIGSREPRSCPAGVAPPVRLHYEHGTQSGADAMHEPCVTQTVSADHRPTRLGNSIAELSGPEGLRLKDDQLDTVAAGLATGASAAAQAEGANAGSNADVFSNVGQPGPQNAVSVGKATASASGSVTTGPATATSMLTLTVTVP